MNLKSQKRIFVLGNSGSGKSWLSGVLSNYYDIKMISLDEVCWEPGGFYKRRSEEDIENDLKKISQNTNWIIEGVYGNIVEILFSRMTHLFWLDLDPVLCAESVSNRGFDNIPWMNTQQKILDYINHIQSYNKSSGTMSREFHKRIFNSFTGQKIFFSNREEVNQFVANLKK